MPFIRFDDLLETELKNAARFRAKSQRRIRYTVVHILIFSTLLLTTVYLI